MQHRSPHFSPTLIAYISMPFVITALTLLALKTRSPFVFGLIWVVPPILLLSNRLDLWVIGFLWLHLSKMRFPGLPGALTLADVMAAGFVGVVFARFVIRKRGVPRDSLIWWLLYLFATLMLGTMYIRGTGMRMLGDSQWGGMRYVGMFVAIAFAFALSHVQLTPRQWKIGMIGMSLVALAPFVCDSVFIASNGAIWQQYYLFQPVGVGDAFEGVTSTGLTRFKSGANVAYALVMLPAFLIPRRAKGRVLKMFPFLLAAAVLVGFSGHRLGVLNCTLFVWLYFFYIIPRKELPALFGITIIGGIMGVAVLLAVGPHLPLSVQRALSFIPYVNFDYVALASAQGTVDWRLTVWERAINEDLPRYWLIGKGFAYDGDLAVFVMQHYNRADIEWALVNSLYHNGPLSLLILLGMPGLILGFMILLVSCVRHHLIAMRPWNNELLQRLHLVMFLTLAILSFQYTFIYGDVQNSFVQIFFLIGILEALVYANRREGEVPKADVRGLLLPQPANNANRSAG